MYKKNGWALLGMLVLGFVLALSLAAPPESAGEGGTVVVDTGSEPENLDPHQFVNATTLRMHETVFEKLVTFAPDSLKIVPQLAESWQMSEDGFQWTFNLRKGVKFHDGTPFNAEAVKFTFDRQLDKENPYYGDGNWIFAPLIFGFVDKVEAVDEFTVRFHLKEPYGYFLERMGIWGAAMIVSPTAVEKYRKDFAINPVGTGPYQFVRWDKGVQVVLERFEEYWGPRPGLDGVIFKAIPEEGARTAALLTGEVQISMELTPQMVEKVEKTEGLEIRSERTGAVWFLSFNTQREPFTDSRVRRAVGYAIDYDSIVRDVMKDTVEVARGPLSPLFSDADQQIGEKYGLGYNLEKARQLLQEAGYAEKYADTAITFYTTKPGSGMLLPEEMALVIQDNLKEVGINTELNVSEFINWENSIRSENNWLTVMSWNPPPTEPDNIFSPLLLKSAFPPGWNTSWWTQDEFEKVVADAKKELDPAKRKALYIRAQEIILEEMPIVPVVHRLQIFGVDQKLKDFAPQPSMIFDLRNARLE